MFKILLLAHFVKKIAITSLLNIPSHLNCITLLQIFQQNVPVMEIKKFIHLVIDSQLSSVASKECIKPINWQFSSLHFSSLR